MRNERVDEPSCSSLGFAERMHGFGAGKFAAEEAVTQEKADFAGQFVFRGPPLCKGLNALLDGIQIQQGIHKLRLINARFQKEAAELDEC